MPPPSRAAAALGISYRPIGEADLPFLFLVYASTRTEELAVTGWPDDAKRNFLAQQFNAQHVHYQHHYPDAEWLVVLRGGEPAGRLYIEEWPDQIRLIDIALLPQHRRAGIGSAILNDVLALAAAKGKPVTIHVERNNPAMQLYRRLGFATLGEAGVYDLLEWRPEGAAPA
jgi:ribosomal protein S18 acetylase RimI-like enzyme